MSWQELVVDSNYEINDETHEIRRKDTKHIVKEHLNTGYLRLAIGPKHYYKHVLIAKQFIPNPENLEYVDHIDLNKTNNSLINLRWCNRLHNNSNKQHQIFVDSLPKGYIKVEYYNNHEYTDLYFANDEFYRWNGMKFKVMPKRHIDGNRYQINVANKLGKNTSIYLKKFKEQYKNELIIS